MRKFVVFANTLILLFALILEVVSIYFLITVIPIFEPFTEIAKLIELIVWGIWFVAVIVSVVLMIAGSAVQLSRSIPYDGPQFPNLSSISNIVTIILGVSWIVVSIVAGDIYGKGSIKFDDVSLKIITFFIARILTAYLKWSYAFNNSKKQEVESLTEKE